MAAGESENEKLGWEDGLRASLFSSSTKRRIAELNSLNSAAKDGELDTRQIQYALQLFADACLNYVDRPSRRAVQGCLYAIAASQYNTPTLHRFVETLQAEASKCSHALTDLLVLMDWCETLLSAAGSNEELWEECGLDLIAAEAKVLEHLTGTAKRRWHISQGNTRASTSLMKLLAGKDSRRLDIFDSIISLLTAKGPSSTPLNTIYLGMIAHVVAGYGPNSDLFRRLQDRKTDFYAYYAREIIGSRSVLPPHIASGMNSFFRAFSTTDGIQKDVMPAVEKAMLRSPEVVLNDLLTPLISSFPKDVDFSAILLGNLLKPLLSNVKSSNANIRSGALAVFGAVAARATDEATLAEIADEILTPLKLGKITAPEQRVAYSQLLESISPSKSLTEKIPPWIAQVVAKEANESAAIAEIACLSKHTCTSLSEGSPISMNVTDAYKKGLSDKKISARKAWAISAGEMLWPLDDRQIASAATMSFVNAIMEAMAKSWDEVLANPLPATQTGLLIVAYVFAALGLTKLSGTDDKSISSLLQKTAISKQLLIAEPKPSFVLNHRVYSKLGAVEDMSWELRALNALTSDVAKRSPDDAVCDAWSQAFIYLLCSPSVPYRVRMDAERELSLSYGYYPLEVGSIMVLGLWHWRGSISLAEKDSAAVTAKSGNTQLWNVIRCITLSKDDQQRLGVQLDERGMETHLISLLVFCRLEIAEKLNWIDTCLRCSVDPGTIVRKHLDLCISTIVDATQGPVADESVLDVHQAAFAAAADLAFVAPDEVVPALVQLLRRDLDAQQLEGIGPTEAGIFRTPEGTAFVDVLASRAQPAIIDKNVKDYDTLKWEAELRMQLEAKQGKPKKLSAAEQAKVNEQLNKESKIRSEVQSTSVKLRRGVGIIRGLATGPPTDAEGWIVTAIDLLIGVIDSGAGLILGDAATEAYIACAEKVSPRLGIMRSFVGLATLRAVGVTQLPAPLLEEPLDDLVTRVLYRLRLLGEQRAFDTVSLAYMLPLVFVVLEQGGTSKSNGEEADEQIVLALEFLLLHADACSDERLPRQRLLYSLISVMQRFTQHFELVKDCLNDVVRGLAVNLSTEETSVLLKATIVDEKPVRTSVLQALDEHVDLSELSSADEIWVACHDDAEENVELATIIWDENGMQTQEHTPHNMVKYLESPSKQLRRAAARALADATSRNKSAFPNILSELQELYIEKAKPVTPEMDKFGMIKNKEAKDPWEARDGIALAFRNLSKSFDSGRLVSFCQFLVKDGALGDRNSTVRREMIEAATEIIAVNGKSEVEPLMKLFEESLDGLGSAAFDKINEAVVILYGALARHLPPGDKRVPNVVQRLLATLRTPSEDVQYAVAMCLPPLVQASKDEGAAYAEQMMHELLQSKKYPTQRGAAYGIAGVVAGKGVSCLREFQIMSELKTATENKKDQHARQGAFLAYELMSLVLGRIFEPYAIQVIPQLLAGFGDSNADVRAACEDTAKQFNSTLSSYGVQQVLPTLLEGLDETQWRSKKGACDMLGTMSHLSPEQLALRLPDIIPPLTSVLTDSHKEVRLAANRSLKQFGEVISNPEVKSVVDVLLKALSDPTKYTDDALDVLIKIQFMHYLDAPSLALVVRILERGLGDRSQTKRKSASIIANLAHLTERKDIISHLPILVAGLRVAVVDPVRETRATAAKALGSLVEKLGEDAMPDLVPSLMAALKVDTGAGDRFGSAQALSEVLAGLGTSRLEETLPTILRNAQSTKPSTREGFMSLFIYLPACFGNSFATHLSKIIPPILSGLADDVESIREIALRAGRLLVKSFAGKAVDLLLPELERGLADDSHRIRLSSVELVGDLLFNLTGISAKGEGEEEEMQEQATEAGQSLLEILGEDRRNKVLSALYICRCDTSGLVRNSAINVWKALVATPRTLKELVPTLTQLIIRRLASSNMEQKVIASNAFGELIRKAGDGVIATLLPTLEEGLQTSTDTDARQGICIALRGLIVSASPETLEDYEKTLISVVRTALVDPDESAREAAAEAFDSLQRIIGKRAVDQVLPNLLNLLRNPDDAENALSALLTLLTDHARSGIILPNLLPTLLTSPMSAFNARAIASLAEVASGAMVRRLPNIINTLMNNIIACKDDDLRSELDAALDAVLLSVDEFDGLDTSMNVMLALAKDSDHRKRRTADSHLGTFFASATVDMSRYYPDLIRTLLIAFDDSDMEVVKAAHLALTALTKKLRKEEMESLVIPTRQVLLQVGVAGSKLPGFGLPKGINAILPIFLQGLMNGSTEQRTQAALAITDIVERADGEAIRPFVTQITGPLIRVVSERSVEVKAAILSTLNTLLEKIPTYLKPFLPQLQRTFAKSLADTSSETLRIRAAKALGTLITMTPRIDPLIAELVTGSKTPDAGVKNAMLKALYEVASKAGSNMNEASRSSILGLIDTEHEGEDDAMAITNARLLGALIKVLPAEISSPLIKSRVLPSRLSKSSVLTLNAVLVECPEVLTSRFSEETVATICKGIADSQPIIADNCILAAGKFLLTESSNKSFENTKEVFESLAAVIPPSVSVDSRCLSLGIVRTVARKNSDLVRPHLMLLTPPIFASVRDMVIPVKLSAEAALLQIFSVEQEDSAVFDKFLAGPGAGLGAAAKRSLQDYFKRIAMRQGAQARERREAEGGRGGLGLTSDEQEDEREIWSVGKVELEDAGFGD